MFSKLWFPSRKGHPACRPVLNETVILHFCVQVETFLTS